MVEIEKKKKFGGYLLQESKSSEGFDIIAIETSNGNSPFYEFFTQLTEFIGEELSKNNKNKRNDRVINYTHLSQYMDRLASSGIWNNPSQIKKLEGILFELKVKATGLRVLFSYDSVNRRVILITHSFIKKTQKTPKEEIERANHLLHDFYKKRQG